MNAFVQSTAVMARRAEPGDSLDFFPTPPWGTRAFAKHVLPLVEDRPAELLTAADPCCGEGHMALALAESFGFVLAADIFPYGFGHVADFLHPDHAFMAENFSPDWIFMNPPFNLAEDFIRQALRFARRGVAALVRLQFLEGEGRYDQIFAAAPPAAIFQYTERLPMHRGRWVINGSTATAYTWLVWTVERRWDRTVFGWIPKSRPALTRPDDWLRFRGCCDLPKDHPAMKLQRGEKLDTKAGMLL